MKWITLIVMLFALVVLTPEQAQQLLSLKVQICPRGTSAIDMTGDGSTDLLVMAVDPKCNLQIEEEFQRELNTKPTPNASQERGWW